MLTMEALRRRRRGELARVSSEGGGVCVGEVFEEMTRVLKILHTGVKRWSEMAGLLKILMMVHRTRSGDNNRVL